MHSACQNGFRRQANVHYVNTLFFCVNGYLIIEYRSRLMIAPDKRNLLALVILLLYGGEVHAQKFTLGAKAGPLISWANFGDKDDRADFRHRPKAGGYAAALIIFPMKNNFSLQTEFGYSRQGRTITFNENTWMNKATYHYLDGAMVLRREFPLRLGENIPSQWFVDVGPRINYWLGGHGTIDAGGQYKYDIAFGPMPETPSSPDFNTMYITDENRWLFGIDAGIGFIAPIRNNRKLLTELRITSGHTYFGKPHSASNRTLGFNDNLRSNQKTISLTLAYLLPVDIQKSRRGKSTKDKEVKNHYNGRGH